MTETALERCLNQKTRLKRRKEQTMIPTLKKISNNFQSVQIGSLTLYFSYATLIAFSDGDGHEICIRKNVWGTTTGKHLNMINDCKDLRIDEDDFNAEYEKAIKLA